MLPKFTEVNKWDGEEIIFLDSEDKSYVVINLREFAETFFAFSDFNDRITDLMVSESWETFMLYEETSVLNEVNRFLEVHTEEDYFRRFIRQTSF